MVAFLSALKIFKLITTLITMTENITELVTYSTAVLHNGTHKINNEI